MRALGERGGGRQPGVGAKRDVQQRYRSGGQSDAVSTAVVDSNSTRTEPCALIRPELETTPVEASKATDLNGYERKIRPSQEMGVDLKILVRIPQHTYDHSKHTPDYSSTGIGVANRRLSR